MEGRKYLSNFLEGHPQLAPFHSVLRTLRLSQSGKAFVLHLPPTPSNQQPHKKRNPATHEQNRQPIPQPLESTPPLPAAEP